MYAVQEVDIWEAGSVVAAGMDQKIHIIGVC